MVTFLTVLKSKTPEEFKDFNSGYAIYKPEHVYALKKQIEIHYPHPHRFICLTDVPDMKCGTIPLKHGLKGWWSKIELFQPELVSQNLDDVFFYFDLDTVLTGDITPYVHAEYKIAGLAEVNAPGLVSGRLGSGIMAWRGDWSVIYNTFMTNPDHYMEKYFVGGDQHLINDIAVKQNGGFVAIQDIAPGCLNYKHDLPGDKNAIEKPIPEGAKIVYYHGVPKPWETKNTWQVNGIYDIKNY